MQQVCIPFSCNGACSDPPPPQNERECQSQHGLSEAWVRGLDASASEQQHVVMIWI
jgi:hypothetical protein